ncbi:MAG: M15 family metallopeptidase [Alphaproteobacteria bacterium]|nr:M15 family metallopeptidase [Alphaproteobacteria bacterium]
MGEKPTIPKKIIQIFEKRGFIWGGDWKRPDGMHWSARRQ